MTTTLALMFSASFTICLKGLPTRKQLRQFRYSERNSSSNKASSRSSVLFFKTGQNVEEREVGIELLRQRKRVSQRNH